jgi:hypothetical protein
VSILDLRNGTGEDNSEDVFSNKQIVGRSNDSEGVFQRKNHIPKDITDVELMHMISEILKHQYLEVNRGGC